MYNHITDICVCEASEETYKFIIIILYIIFKLKAGGHRGLGGVGDQRRHLPGTGENVPAGLWWCTWAHLSRSWWPP